MTQRVKFLFRRDWSPEWEQVNPVLSAGEPGVDMDPVTGESRLKVGDGSTPWNDLGYVSDNPRHVGVHVDRWSGRMTFCDPDPGERPGRMTFWRTAAVLAVVQVPASAWTIADLFGVIA